MQAICKTTDRCKFFLVIKFIDSLCVSLRALPVKEDWTVAELIFERHGTQVFALWCNGELRLSLHLLLNWYRCSWKNLELMIVNLLHNHKLATSQIFRILSVNSVAFARGLCTTLTVGKRI